GQAPVVEQVHYGASIFSGSLAVCLFAPVPAYRSGMQGEAGEKDDFKFFFGGIIFFPVNPLN
ncbi:MAG: hypothetical protein KY055_02550, partial [Candidatus Nealsonbacteria bacterium]|nr:hypothetical protein [Candidatus Nealsonbacteria bacterium]